MWTFLQSNADVVSALSSVAMLGVWSLYLHLIYQSYRRSRSSKILINRGARRSLEASCLVSNMSVEPIYLEAVRISLEGESEPQIVSLSDLDVTSNNKGDRRAEWLQGPLGSSEMIDIGSFRSLIERTQSGAGQVQEGGANRLVGRSFTIVVLATLTSEEGLVAAERQFHIKRRGREMRLQAHSPRTRQISSGAARRRMEAGLEQEFRDEWQGLA